VFPQVTVTGISQNIFIGLYGSVKILPYHNVVQPHGPKFYKRFIYIPTEQMAYLQVGKFENVPYEQSKTENLKLDLSNSDNISQNFTEIF
jgi:hypothetical protein